MTGNESLEVAPDDLSSGATRDLLALHLQGMHANSPPGSVFALDLSGLLAPEITVWTARRGQRILGVGALRQLPDGTGEVKSMRTHPNYIRNGVARLLLEHMIVEAKMRGLKRLSLETGSGSTFEPALALYRTRGFVDGEPFSDYVQSAFNQFLHLNLG